MAQDMQPIDTSKEMAVQPPEERPDRLRALGNKLSSRFSQYEKDRRLAELRWMQNLRQFLGQYDPEIEARLQPGQSRAYPRLTRVKVVSMVSRLMSLLFPSSEKNWGLDPSPVPNLTEETMNGILQDLTTRVQQAQQAGEPVDVDAMATDMVERVAADRSVNLEELIDDQLTELGGSKHTSYVALCRKVIMSGVLYNTGILGGPYVETRQKQTWAYDEFEQRLVPQTDEEYRPRFEFVPVWDYYPDMSAKTWEQMDGQFQRYVMSRQQVIELKNRPDFKGAAIDRYLKDHQDGNYQRRTHETELKAMGVQNNVNDQNGTKYEVLKWEGYLYKSDLDGTGVELPPGADGTASYPATVWFIGDTVIKADLNPWYRLTKGGSARMYHHFVFEEDDTNIFGNGLPNIMRDSQMSVALAARMALDNASVVCGPQAEVDLRRLRPDQDLTSIHAFKIWYRDEDIPESQYPAVKEIKFDSHLDDLTALMRTFMDFADQETFIGAATGGDMSQGPSEPFRTAAGASLLKGDAALPFKDVVRNFDCFTESVIASLVTFNQKLNGDDEITGDMQVVARGASSLVAKEVRGIQLDSYIQTLTADERKYVNWYELARERAAARDLPLSKVLVNQQQAQQIEQAESEAAQSEQETNEKLIEASIRKVLTDAMKNITQSDQNSARAFAEQMNAAIAGMEAENGPDNADSQAGGSQGRLRNTSRGGDAGSQGAG